MVRSALVCLARLVLCVLIFSGQALAWTSGLKEAADAFALGTATPSQEMMAFIHNKEVNLLAQEGKISMKTYRNCQEEFFKLNEGFANKAVRDAGFDPSIGDRKYNPGTDTDVNVLGKGNTKITLNDVQKIDANYQRIVKDHFRSKGLNPPTNKIETETDFMPHPEHADPEEFRKIVEHINQNGGSAYSDPRAASAQSKLGTTRPMTIDEASSFSSTMKDMAEMKIKNANALRGEAKALRASDPGRAEYLEAQARQYDYQAAKYHNRIDAANNHIRKQYHLPENPRNITGFQQSADIIELSGRNPFTGKDASTIHNLHQSALQSSTDDMIDTLVEIAKQDPSKAARIQQALGKEINRLPPNRAGQAIERIENATKGIKGLDKTLATGAVSEARMLKQAGAVSTKWTSFKDRMKNVTGFNRMTKFSVFLSVGTAVIIGHQGVTITLNNVKATDTLWDYFRNCYYHAAWEGTGIGPAFEQAQREEIERYMKDFEAGQSPSMVKHVTFTLLKTGTYMGRDALVGILYLPDTVWEYFTQEKEMEGYAAMQNELARIMRQMIKDQKEFDQVMANMKKMGLNEADAKPYLDCLCAGCGGSLGGFFNPACTSDIGHGPCQCNGPLTIWKAPLPAGNKKAQHDCFNRVAKMRYNEAQSVFNAWRQQMIEENAKSVQPELDAIKADIASGKAKDDEQTARNISDQFSAIKDMLLPQDVDSVRAMVGPYLQNHAARNLEAGDIARGVDNLDRALNKVGPRSEQGRADLVQRKAQFENWAKIWKDVKEKQLPNIGTMISQKRLQRARGEIAALEHKMLKDPAHILPPAINDPALLGLKERLEKLGQQYEQAMQDMWAKVKPMGPDREHRLPIPILEKALEEWDHPQHTLEALKGQLAYHQRELQKAESAKKLGQEFEKNGDLADAVREYTASVRIQKDSALEKHLEWLSGQVQKQAQARELWRQAQDLQHNQHYEEALAKYNEGLAIWTDPAIQDRVAKLRQFLEDRKKQAAAQAAQKKAAEEAQAAQKKAAEEARVAQQKAAQAAQKKAETARTAQKDAVVQESTTSGVSAGTLNGTWKITANGFGGSIEFQTSGNQLTGRLRLDANGYWETLTNVHFDGKTLRFMRPIPSMDQHYTGHGTGAEFSGTFDQAGKGAYPWKMWRGQTAATSAPKPGAGKDGAGPATTDATEEAQSAQEKATQAAQKKAAEEARTAQKNTAKTGGVQGTEVSGASAGTLNGTWKITANGLGGSIEFQTSGNQLTGRLRLDANGYWETLTNVHFDGKTLRFMRPIPSMDQHYTGHGTGAEFSGTFDQAGKGAYPWKMWREQTAATSAPKPGAGKDGAGPATTDATKTVQGGSGQTGPGTGAEMSEWTVNYGLAELTSWGIATNPPSEGNTSYYVAPASVLGNWSGVSHLSFEKESHGGEYIDPYSYGGDGDVVIESPRGTARFTIEADHSGNWRQFHIDLGGPGWTLSGGAQSMSEILANVTGLRIRAEYGAGEDFSALRAFRLIGGSGVTAPPETVPAETTSPDGAQSVESADAGEGTGTAGASPAGWKTVRIGNIRFAVPASWQHSTQDDPNVDKLRLYWDGDFDDPRHGISGGIAADYAQAKADLTGATKVRIGGMDVLRAGDMQSTMELLFPPMSGNRGVALVVFRGTGGSQKTIDQVLGTFALDGQESGASEPVQSETSGTPEVSFEVGNIHGVYNGPTAPTTFSLASSRVLAMIQNYHWNSGQGATPGTIALREAGGKTHGPWQTEGSPGQGGVPNAYWTARPMVVLPAGTYTVIDSDPATWAHNKKSGGRGFTKVETLPVNAGAAPGMDSTAGGPRWVNAAKPDHYFERSVSAQGVRWTEYSDGQARFVFEEKGGSHTHGTVTLYDASRNIEATLFPDRFEWRRDGRKLGSRTGGWR